MPQTHLVVLAHGIFGWGDTPQEVNGMSVHFSGIGAFLTQHYPHVAVCAPSVPPAERVAKRAKVLDTKIAERLQDPLLDPDARVHLIAHSMGGLDARWLLVHGQTRTRVASLTTIATPHHGTSLGNLAYQLRDLIQPVGGVLDPITDALTGFERAALRVFNMLPGQPFTLKKSNLGFLHHFLANIAHSRPEARERALSALTLAGAQALTTRLQQAGEPITGMDYFAYGGDTRKRGTLLALSRDYIALHGRPEERQGNDGAVSVWSAHLPWDAGGQRFETVPYDHFEVLNWPIPSLPSPDLPPELEDFYRGIMNRILA